MGSLAGVMAAQRQGVQGLLGSKALLLPLAGGKRVQHASGRLPHRPVWGYAAVAHTSRAAAGTHAEAARSPEAGGKCGAAPVPCGPQHPGLPQSGAWPHST